MSRKGPKRRRGSKYRVTLQKPGGVLSPRVQAVGPEHFSIVSIDCGKGCSEWMLVDFYGKVLLPAAPVRHTRVAFELAIGQLRDALQRFHIKDLVVAVERTGDYHLPVKRAFSAAGFETRIVHPFATKQFRQPADPGNKTDETDLAAIARATINGFGLLESPPDEIHEKLRLLARHRRDLVRKRSALNCQIREHLDAVLPGYADNFPKLWESNVVLFVAAHYGSAAAMQVAGEHGIDQLLRSNSRRFHRLTIARILVWATNAATAHQEAPTHQRIWRTLDEDRVDKTLKIQELERELAGLLVRCPYILLLSHPGINVVSAAELAGEMGPITNYANAKCITGRAGLFPSRYQSNETDRADGKIVQCANHHLRAVLMMIADNLLKCNQHFRSLAALWRAQGKDPRHTRVRIASRFTRIAYQMVAGRQVYRHPSRCERSYILDKLVEFHREHETAPERILTDLNLARRQIPASECSGESVPLRARYEKTRRSWRKGPQPIGDVLLSVLAKLGVGTIESEMSEAQGPNRRHADREDDNVFRVRGENP